MPVEKRFWLGDSAGKHTAGPERLAAAGAVRAAGEPDCAAAEQHGARQGGAAAVQGGHERQQGRGHPQSSLLHHSRAPLCAPAQRGAHKLPQCL